MQWGLLGRLACGLLLGLVPLGLPPTGRAAEPERVKFDTFDQVEIHGTFYPGSSGTKSNCVMLLHALGGSSQQEGWDDLARRLQAKGFAVLTFDFRGHGDSTTVGPGFWTILPNQRLRRFQAGRPKDQISYKDFTNLYELLSPVNDIVAAKRYLDRRNDAGDCNSANVVVVGAESGAVLGALWVWEEWHRPRAQMGLGGFQVAGATQMEGQDISGAVYLSLVPQIVHGRERFNIAQQLDSWFRNPVRDRVPMLFLYGEQDKQAARFARYVYRTVLHGDKLKLTVEKDIKGTKLAGHELLGKPSLPTENYITEYVTKVMQDRVKNPYAKKDVERTRSFLVPLGQLLRSY